MIEKLIEFITKEKHRFEKNLIYQQGNNYCVFGQYCIEVVSVREINVYKRQDRVGQFVNASSAMAWCIADKYNQIELAKNILITSQNHQRLADDIEINRMILKKSQNDLAHDMLNNKLYFKLSRLCSYQQQLKKMINQTKYLQNKGFNYEAH